MPAPDPFPFSPSELLESFAAAAVRYEVRDHLMAGRKALVIGRNSGEAGIDPAIAAVKSLESGLESLASYGLDYRPLVPDRAELIRRLRNGETVKSKTADGSTFKNTFVVIDLAPFPVVLLLSMGSAKKLDQDFTQPFVHFLAKLCADVRPGLLFAARIDRLVRHAWAFGEPMTVLEAIGGYAGDERGRFVHPTGIEAIQVFFDASNAQTAAETIPSQVRKGQARATESRMVKGRVRYGVGSQPPAGIARVRMRDGTSDGASELYLEAPELLPDATAVAYGLPEVFDEDGRRVDQVANVKWALSVLGKKKWPDVKVARKLVERGFSTTGLRSLRKDPAAVWTEEDVQSGSLLDALYRRLDFYESGRLECRSDEFGPIVVEGCFPLDGKWATPADFRRIREHEQAAKVLFSNRATTTFAGLHVEVNGVPSRMYLREGDKFRVRSYGLRCTVPGKVTFTHQQLAAAITTAIATAGDDAVHLVPIADDSSDLELRTVAAERRPIELELIVRKERLKWLRMRLDETLVDGTPALTGDLAAEVNTEYNALAGEAREREAQLTTLEERAARRRLELRTDASRVRLDVLLHMIASLRDPSAMQHRDAWRAGLHDLRLTSTEVTAHGHTGQRITLHGWLGVGDDIDDQTFRVPLHATWTTGPISEIDDRVETIADGMRNGVPYADSKVPLAKHLRAALCEHLGTAGRMLAACDDGRIVRIAMAVTVDRAGQPVSEIAVALGEPEVLVHRVAEHFSRACTRGRWYTGSSPLRAAVYAFAAAGDGFVHRDQIVPARATRWRTAVGALDALDLPELFTVRGDRLELVGRCECAPDLAPWFAEMVIAEPAGPVCRRCWRDQLGVHWPKHQYERYVLEMDDDRPRRRRLRRR